MKYVLLLLLFLPITCWSQGKITVSIEEVTLSNVIRVESSDTYIEGKRDGPYVNLECILINSSDSTIYLYPSKSKLVIEFNYNSKLFKDEVFSFEFQEIDSISLSPNECIKFSTGKNLFLGTGLLDESQKDYTLDLLMSIPTLKLVISGEGFRIKSNQIKSIKINK